MNRREFTKQTLILAASALLARCQTANVIESSEKIIVIGAGMAGMAAARMLHDAGASVTVLEGRDRVGGRVWSSRSWPDVTVDLGGSWIHGVRGNPLTALADEIDAPRLETDYDNVVLYDSAGRLAPDRTWTAIEQQLQNVWRAISAADESMTIADAIDAEFELATMSAAERTHLGLAVNGTIEQEFAANIDQLSAVFLDEGESFGGNDVIFPEGYDQLVQHLAQGIDVRLSETVTAIAYTPSGVTVTTQSGSFDADRVIVTLPIGVLQRESVQFNPPLPAAKREAIAVLGSGVMNKCYLRFAEAFWQRQPEWIIYSSEPRGQFSFWLNFYHYVQEPVLLAFNVGEFGRKIESWSDDEIIAAAMDTLRKMYGSDIADPINYQITRWASDPFAHCSYSYPAVGMTEETRDNLAEPVNNRLFFAGEATHSDYPSTVHGAFLSGQREAERIIDLLG